MAESVRELVVSGSLEAGTFSKTCKDINQQIKGVEAEFNNITAGAGSWTDTMAGRKAKMDALTKRLTCKKRKSPPSPLELEKQNSSKPTPATWVLRKRYPAWKRKLNNAEGRCEKQNKRADRTVNQISLKKLGLNAGDFWREPEKVWPEVFFVYRRAAVGAGDQEF